MDAKRGVDWSIPIVNLERLRSTSLLYRKDTLYLYSHVTGIAAKRTAAALHAHQTIRNAARWPYYRMTIIAFQVGHATLLQALSHAASLPWESRIDQPSKSDPRIAQSAGGRRAADVADTPVDDDDDDQQRTVRRDAFHTFGCDCRRAERDKQSHRPIERPDQFQPIDVCADDRDQTWTAKCTSRCGALPNDTMSGGERGD